MKQLLFIFLIFGVVFGAFWWLQTGRMPESNGSPDNNQDSIGVISMESVVKKASFLIFTNGLRRDFSGSMYERRSDDAYLGDGSLGIITIVKPDTTWDEFFLTLPFSLTEKCLTTGLGQEYCDGDGGDLRFFLNDTETTSILNRVIRDGDRLLVTFGNATQEEIDEQYKQVPIPRRL